MQEKNLQLFSWLMLFALALVWGSSFILIKKGLEVFSAVEVGALRIASASLFLAPVALARFYRIKRQHLLLLMEVGFVGSLGPAFFFAIAQTRIPSSLTGVLNALTPMFVAVIGALFFSQKFHRHKIIGLTVGFAGTITLILSGSAGQFSKVNYYALFVMLATFDSGFQFIVAFLVVAMLPAFGEELLFRGLIQNELKLATRNIHIAIWVSAFFFGFFHLQFYGLVPRMLLGVLFGYLYFWSGSLLYAIVGHFINNGFTLIMLYMHQKSIVDYDIQSTESTPLQTVLFFFIIGTVLSVIFIRYYQKQKADHINE